MARKAKKKVEIEKVVEIVKHIVKVEAVKDKVEPVKDVKPKETVKDRILKNMKAFDENYFKSATCNYKSFGDWQKLYATMMDRLFAIKDSNILDIGGAYGSLGHAMANVGADVTVLDISKHVINEKMFKNVKYVLAPIQTMKAIKDKTIGFVHISHVLNYVDNKDIEMSLKEIKRVMKDDGKCFIIMDIAKKGNFEYSEKDMLKHIENAGLVDITDECAKDVKKLPKSLNYFKEYMWDFFVLKK